MSDVRELTTVLADEARAADHVVEHPPVDQLLAYLGDELAAGDAERLQDHLVACRECAARLLELEPLTEPDAPRDDGVADLAAVAGWRDLERRLAPEGPVRPARAARPRVVRLPWAVAAAFFVAVLGLATWLGRPGDPIANLPRLAIDSSLVVRGPESALEIPAGREPFLLFVTPSASRSATGEPFTEYVLELRSSAGRVVLEQDGLEPVNGVLTLLLRPRHLPAGRYDVRLYGVAGGEREEVDHYPGVDVRRRGE